MSKIDLREMVGGALQDKFQHSFETETHHSRTKGKSPSR